MDRLSISGNVPADLAEVMSDRPFRRAPDADEAYDRQVQREIDDPRFVLVPELMPEPPTPTTYERLERLLAQHRGLALMWGTTVARSKEDARWIKGKHEYHRVACKSLRQRIDRMVRRGRA